MQAIIKAEFEIVGKIDRSNPQHMEADKYWNTQWQSALIIRHVSIDGDTVRGVVEISPDDFDVVLADFYDLDNLSSEDLEEITRDYLIDALNFPNRCTYLRSFDSVNVEVFYSEVI